MSEEIRPWGSFKVLLDTPLYKIKEIKVQPGHRLSYQSHQHRCETWTIVIGTAIITMDGYEWEVSEEECVWIEAGAKHRISNRTNKPLVFIEVQTGSYFGEDDIVRYEDDYSRESIGFFSKKTRKNGENDEG